MIVPRTLLFFSIAQVAAAIKKNPQHEPVSDFAGLHKELSERVGAPESARAFSDSLGVTGQ